AADSAGGAIDYVVNEIHAALMLEVLLVNQLERHDNACVAAGHLTATLRQPLVAKIGRLVEGKFESNWIRRYDGGKQRGIARGAAGDQISRRNATVADATGDRGSELGEFKVEGRLADRRLLGLDRGIGDPLGLGALVEGLFGDGALPNELRTARKIGFRKG